jgi:fluoride exporter
MQNIALLIVGGSAGTLARFFLSGLAYRTFGTDFPYGTLIVNLSGCFFIGLFAVLAEEKFVLGSDGRMLLMVGFCGAFTTFSTLIFESANLIRYGEVLRSFMNLGVSVMLGFFMFWLGVMLGRAI